MVLGQTEKPALERCYIAGFASMLGGSSWLYHALIGKGQPSWSLENVSLFLKGMSIPTSTKSKDKSKLLMDLQSCWDIFTPLLKQVQSLYKNVRGLYKHNEQMVIGPTLEIKHLHRLEKIISD